MFTIHKKYSQSSKTGNSPGDYQQENGQGGIQWSTTQQQKATNYVYMQQHG